MKKPKLILRQKKKPVQYASYSYQQRHYAIGLCRRCPNPAEINPRTGKFYHACPWHLAKIAEYQKLLMRKRRT
jgi:hypothetical protein